MGRIGANSAVFSVADSVLLRPLPYPDPERLAVFVVRAPEQLRLRGILRGPRHPTLRGRPFSDGDTSGMPPVAVVNGSFVRRFFPDGEVLGRRIDPYAFSPEVDDAPRTIVGVVGDTKNRDLAGAPRPSMYVPLDQATAFSMKVAHRVFEANWIVRHGAQSLSAGELERAIREIAPTQPFSRFRTMKEVVAENVATERFQASLLGSFAVLGLLVAAVGLYGLVSFTVAGRTREIWDPVGPPPSAG